MTQKVCLITGATGFIGQNVTAKLISLGYKVIALGEKINYNSTILKDNNIKITTQYPLNKDTFKTYDVALYFGDISNERFVKSIFDTIEKANIKLDYILHFAACSTIQAAKRNIKRTWKTNYQGTQNLLKQSLAYTKKSLNHQLTGFFHASTDKVYGEGSLETYDEYDKLNPLPYPYDASKAKADALVRKIALENDFPAVVYRFCNVFGPGDYHKSRLVPGTLHRLLHKKEQPVLKLYKDEKGMEQSFYRDMIYINDLTEAISLLLKYMEDKNNRKKIQGKAFNLGTNNSYSIKDIIEKIMVYSGSNVKARKIIVKSGEIKQQCMNYKRLNELLGFYPKYNIEKGLKETVEWYNKHIGENNGKFI